MSVRHEASLQYFRRKVATYRMKVASINSADMHAKRDHAQAYGRALCFMGVYLILAKDI